MSLYSARSTLLVIWLVGCAGFILVLGLQTAGGKYAGFAQEAWTWATPQFLPSLSLMVSTFAADAVIDKKQLQEAYVRVNYYRLAVVASLVYLALLIAAPLAVPFVAVTETYKTRPSIEALKVAAMWLAPSQAIVVLLVGSLFFAKKVA